jgi:tetratricopeptide (TPR) repeat protein
MQVECYQRAVGLDRYLAIAYFQQGVSNFLLGDFEEALANFNDTLLYLRGNTSIDYEQLGLRFRLYSCEVLFNRGLCYVYLRQMGPGMQDLEYAGKEKVTTDHDVIDDAIRENADVCTGIHSLRVSLIGIRDIPCSPFPWVSCTVPMPPKSRTSKPKTI